MKGLGRELRNSFLAGLLVVMPVVASVWILWWLVTFLTAWLPPRWHGPQYRLVALVLMVGVTTAVGWLTRLMIGRRLLAATEQLIARVPLLNKTYGFTKEISHTLLAGHKTMFERVVLVQYPRTGIYTIGFVTNRTGGEVQYRTREEVVNVFFPTTPNPTSGWLAMVPRTQVTELQMSVAEGMKLIISGGTVVPPFVPPEAGGEPARHAD